MSAFFVTGTGTDIGKTYVTAALLRHLRAAGRRPVAVFKPVLSGFDGAAPEISDAAVLLAAAGEEASANNIAATSPWRFAAPLSPDMAAAREGEEIDFDELVMFTRAASRLPGTVLVEGVGGVMVPLDGRHTVLDWLEAAGLPVLLVAGSYLGTLSHTLTALTALQTRSLAPAALVVNESAGSTVPLDETVATLARFTDRPIHVVPRDGPPDLAPLIATLGL
jgi:dethiobiotin synthetase